MGTPSASPSASSSFGDYEGSAASAAPVGAVDCAYGSTHWRFTTGASTVTVAGETYSPQAGARVGKLEISRNAMRNLLEITVPWSAEFVKDWLASPPDGSVAVTVYHVDVAGGFARRWYGGFVKSLEWKEERKAIIRCVNAANDIVGGLCLRCGRMCQVALWSDACGLDPTDDPSWQIISTVGSVDGVNITATAISGQADGWWIGGRLTASAQGVTRMVIDHAGDTVKFNAPIPGLAAGDAFALTAGCDHLQATCETKFNNLANFQGQPHMPDVNVYKNGVL